jgi:hypothetical protein
MADPTDSLLACAQYVLSQLKDNKAELGLEGVFYGDQTKIPHVPTACVEPSDKVRDQQGEPRLMVNTMEVIILLYLMRIGDVQSTRIEVDKVAEDVEAQLHKDAQMGGLAYRSYVSRFESGYTQRGNSLFRSARLTFHIESKTRLPYGGV